MSAVSDCVDAGFCSDGRWIAAALSSFEHMTTPRLNALAKLGSAAEAWAVVAGDAPVPPPLEAIFARNSELRRRWRRQAVEMPPERMREWCDQLAVSVVVPGDADYPASLVHDPRRPALLFVSGSMSAIDMRRVAIVGTRKPTRRGAQTAARFGHQLADGGVSVVSGLALGIDAAAHRGALESSNGQPIAVVANGLDAPYPRRHATLWHDIAERGAVISEWPPGTTPEPFRFPQRNRIIAALSELVVVVESRERGGSLLTALDAAERGVDVFAVPGPVDERSSAGTNALLRDGAAAVTSSEVLFAALGLDSTRAGNRRVDTRRLPAGDERPVLSLCVEQAQSVETIAQLLDLPLAASALALARLERSGWVSEVGGWFEAIDDYADLV